MSAKYEIHMDIIVDHYKNHIQHQKKYKPVLDHLLIYNIAYYYHDLGDMSHLSMTSSSVEDIICTLNECKCCERHQIDRPDCLYPDKHTYLCMYSLEDSYNRIILNDTIDKTKTSVNHIIPDKYIHCNCLCRNTSRAFVRNFNPNTHYEQERLWIIDTLHSQIKYIQLNLELYNLETLQYTIRFSQFIHIMQTILNNISSDIISNNRLSVSYEHIQKHIDLEVMQNFKKTIRKLLRRLNETIEHVHLHWSDILDIHTTYIEHVYEHPNISFPQDEEIQIIYRNVENELTSTMKRTEHYFGEEYSISIKNFFSTLDNICEKKHYFYESLYFHIFDQCASIIHDIKLVITRINDLQLNNNIDIIGINIDESLS